MVRSWGAEWLTWGNGMPGQAVSCPLRPLKSVPAGGMASRLGGSDWSIIPFCDRVMCKQTLPSINRVIFDRWPNACPLLLISSPLLCFIGTVFPSCLHPKESPHLTTTHQLMSKSHFQNHNNYAVDVWPLCVLIWQVAAKAKGELVFVAIVPGSKQEAEVSDYCFHIQQVAKL